MHLKLNLRVHPAVTRGRKLVVHAQFDFHVLDRIYFMVALAIVTVYNQNSAILGLTALVFYNLKL